MLLAPCALCGRVWVGASVLAGAGAGAAVAEVVEAGSVVAVRSGAVDPHGTWVVVVGTTGMAVAGMTGSMTVVAVAVSAAPAVGGTVPETALGSAIGTGTGIGTGRGTVGTGRGRGTVGTGPGIGMTAGSVGGRTDPETGTRARHAVMTAGAGMRWGGSCRDRLAWAFCPLGTRLHPPWRLLCRRLCPVFVEACAQ